MVNRCRWREIFAGTATDYGRSPETFACETLIVDPPLA
jgi:hypothetical protein